MLKSIDFGSIAWVKSGLSSYLSALLSHCWGEPPGGGGDSRFHAGASASHAPRTFTRMLKPMNPAQFSATNASALDRFGCNRGTLAVVALFFLCLVPILSDVATYHIDENFYTNAAIRMVQTGEYLTPHRFDGLERFNKPILAYWVAAASYKLLGIDFFSSRIPFLLAACLLIPLVCKMTRSLFQSDEAGIAAAVVLVSNIQVLTLATRATPDILLCLFVTLSFYGFTSIIFNRDRRLLTYFCAYTGAALAIETKGALGILPVAYSFLYCYFQRKQGAKPGELVEWRAILVGALVALSWFILMYVAHGMGSLKMFFVDQVGERLEGAQHEILHNLVSYVWALLRHFAPWTVVAAVAFMVDRSAIGAFWRKHREQVVYILGWCVLVVVVFSGGNLMRTRYLLPSYPLLATLLGALVVWTVQGKKTAWIAQVLPPVMLAAGVIGGLGLAFVGIFIDSGITIGGGLIVLASVLLFALFRSRRMSAVVAAGLFMVLVYSAVRIFIDPGFSPATEKAVTHRLLELAPDGAGVAAIDIAPSLYNKVHVLSGGVIEPALVPPDAAPESIAPFKVVIIPGGLRGKFSPEKYRMEECTYIRGRWTWHDVWAAVTSNGAANVLTRLEKPYYIAVRIAP